MATVLVVILAGPSAADRVDMADGRVLEGKFVLLPGVAVDPKAAPPETTSTSILVCDDDLTRTMVSKRKVVKAEPGQTSQPLERIAIPQRVASEGRRVVGVGGILETTPFDGFGRRVLSLATASGRLDIVQGITQITPRWTSLETVAMERPHILDMRVATSSIPRDALAAILDKHVDRTDSDARLGIVRLYLQSERFDDARRELDGVLRDFPDLAGLAAERDGLVNLMNGRILDEIRQRGRAGQDRLAIRLLEGFPVEHASGEILEAVREERDRYRTGQSRAQRLVAALAERAGRLEDEIERELAERVVGEIQRELTFATLERLATFERLGLEPDMPDDRGVAIGVSGWLLGAAAATDNLKLALSAARVRGLLRDFIMAGDRAGRAAIRSKLADEEAFDAQTLAAIARLMRPPVEPPPAKAPGLHELTVPGLEGQEPTTCLVQLPPEYDPLRHYSTVVTLHASWSTPLNQIEWWAGMPGPDGGRLGQAGRHGFIVVAPVWTREGQGAYEYSAREHAAVLNAVREATKRFSIDTDRVFLSGHSMGGDAAWDIALAHPDLWAGLVAIAPAAGKYVTHYWRNAEALPIYIVDGELDAGCFQRNTMDLDRYFAKGFDATYVEYRGRGHEHFSDEILRIFEWMGRKRRTFFPSEIDAVSLRPWDNFFWWVELSSPPARTVVLPDDWPPPKGSMPLAIDAKTTPGNTVVVRCGAGDVTVWLSPELVNLQQPVTVTINGRQAFRGEVAPDLDVMLEDLRLRGDRRHPFWAKVESR
ncbi:MAG: prolyl oligopeptidase family serine peptidase [Planctomycetia bacterium]